jgi:octaprenyl-diphosphate synthase
MPMLDTAAALRDVEALLQRACMAEEPLLAEMARKMVGAGGKRLRPRVLLLAHAAAGAANPKQEALEAAAGIELIHTATLVHDDIIDRGDRRRGAWATHREYGTERAIVAGDYLFIKGFELSARQDAITVGLTAKACQALAEAEVLEIGAMEKRDLGLGAYQRIIAGKTAAPLEACGRIGAHLAGRDDLMDALGTYGHHLGMAFQVTDDLLDLRGDPKVTGKPRGTDLRSGAPNATVVLGMGNGSRAKLERLLGPDRTEAQVQQAIEVLLASGAVAQAEALGKEHAAMALAALDPVPDGPAKRELQGIVHDIPKRVT